MASLGVAPNKCLAKIAIDLEKLDAMVADFQTITRSITLAEPTNLSQELWQAGVGLLTTWLPPGYCWGSASAA